ncbi:tau 95 subunit of transcription factor TFIIIC [Arachnomyces sp. PD_36]|nr:tau 95 subunit of transcription factor TFIIIC [Arachnomyces sp. PD_36]
MGEKRTHDRSAPWYSIPSRQIVSVEHPCIVKNIDKGIETLQGDSGISQACAPASLSLRPEDALSRPLKSTSSAANNVLLRVVVPKRTGRRRKKGSGGEFEDVPGSTTGAGEGEVRDAAYLQRLMLDNVGRYRVEAIGTVDRMHVFRGMPDFVFSTTASPFTNQFREKILPFEYEKLQEFNFDMTRGSTSNVDIIPPPAFSYTDIPFNYIYRQNPTIKQTLDPTSGTIKTINTQRPPKINSHLVPHDIPSVPTAPLPSLPPLHLSPDKTLQETVSILRTLFSTRPAWTRRGLRNCLRTSNQKYVLKNALAYVAYTFRSGPWRDAILRFGYDPRKVGAESRFYQTFTFQIVPPDGSGGGGEGGMGGAVVPGFIDTHGRRTNGASAQPEPTPTPAPETQAEQQPSPSHIFTGLPPLPRDGKMWMICDISDPLLHELLHSTPRIRSTCDPLTDGWYGNLTLAKARTIMRSKILSNLLGQVPNDEDFRGVLEFPEHVDSEEELRRVVRVSVSGSGTGATGAGTGAGNAEEGARLVGLAAEVRASIRTAPQRGAKGGGRFWGLDEEVVVDKGEGVGGGAGGAGAGEAEEEGGEHDYDEQDVFDNEGKAEKGSGGEDEEMEEEEEEEVNEEEDDEEENGVPMDVAPG